MIVMTMTTMTMTDDDDTGDEHHDSHITLVSIQTSCDMRYEIA